MTLRSPLIFAGAGYLFAAGLLACSSLLGFDDLTSGSDAAASGNDAASDATNDTTGIDGAPSTPPGAPSNVVAAPALVTTLAGSGSPAFANGAGAAASFNAPVGIAVDTAGNVYVADSLNHRIRHVTPAGVVSTLAGSGAPAFAEGMGASASFNTPTGVTVYAGIVYVADSKNHRIRKVTATGVVSTLAGSGSANHFDGTGTMADFNSPRDVTADNAGYLFVADTDNHRIRRVTTALGDVVSVVGSSGNPDPDFSDGQDATAKFHTPTGVAADTATGNVFIADSDNHRIRALATVTRVVTTPAGSGMAKFSDGTGAAASFDSPRGVAADAAGNVYVADSLNHRIRKMTSAGVVTTLAGSGTGAFADGAVGAASFDTPAGIAADAAGTTIYVGDTNNHRIRKVVALGTGQLAVAWNAPATAGSSPITGYTASASAAGHATGTCMVAAPATTCTMTGLASGVVYTVSVTAMSGTLTSAPSASTAATPN